MEDEKHEKKSEKEESFINKNVFFMVLNCLILPIFSCAVVGIMSENFNSTIFDPPVITKNPDKVIDIGAINVIDMGMHTQLYTNTFD